MEQVSEPTTDVATDGRRARRHRNRETVVEALLGLLDSGRLDASIADVAAAAGLSERSVFRYFDDADDLTRAAIARQQQRLAPLFGVAIDPVGPFAERVHRFASARVRLLQAMGTVGRVARWRAHDQPVVAAEVARIRRELRRQLLHTFATELACLEPARGTRRVAAVDVACSFESFELLRDDHGLTLDEAAAVMAEAIEALLGTAEP